MLYEKHVITVYKLSGISCTLLCCYQFTVLCNFHCMCRRNLVDERMLDAQPPPQPSEYQSMVVDEPPLNHAVPYIDVSMQQDLGSKFAELQRDGYTHDRWQPVCGLNEASPDKWRPVSGLREHSPDASFRSHYSGGFDDRAVSDGMAWHSQHEVKALHFISGILMHSVVPYFSLCEFHLCTLACHISLSVWRLLQSNFLLILFCRDVFVSFRTTHEWILDR